MKILYKHGHRVFYYSDKCSILQVIDIKVNKAELTTVESAGMQFEILSRIINHLVNPADDRRCIVLDD